MKAAVHSALSLTLAFAACGAAIPSRAEGGLEALGPELVVYRPTTHGPPAGAALDDGDTRVPCP